MFFIAFLVWQIVLFRHFFHGFDALGASLDFTAGNRSGLQIDVLAFVGFDVGMRPASVFGGAAAA